MSEGPPAAGVIEIRTEFPTTVDLEAEGFASCLLLSKSVSLSQPAGKL